jgi:hypothetical protein
MELTDDLVMEIKTARETPPAKWVMPCKLSVLELVARRLQSVQVHSTRAPFSTMHR